MMWYLDRPKFRINTLVLLISEYYFAAGTKFLLNLKNLSYAFRTAYFKRPPGI